MRNILPDHGLKGPQLVQGQGVCHEAVGKNRDELDVHQENVFRKGELETTLTIVATTTGTVTQTRHPNDPKRRTREGARQTDRHEHEHSTTALEQRPEAPMGSTGTHQGGPAGPCQRQECTYEWHKRNWKYGYGAPRNTGKWIVHATLPGRRKMSLNYALGLLMYSCRFCS